jgi:predicted DNA-binding transcriptional regulator AlpA
MTDLLLRTADVSKRYGFPEATLRYWRHLNIGPRSARIGRRVVYRDADVQDWINAQFEAGR